MAGRRKPTVKKRPTANDLVMMERERLRRVELVRGIDEYLARQGQAPHSCGEICEHSVLRQGPRPEDMLQ